MCLAPKYIVTPFLRDYIDKGCSTFFVKGRVLFASARFMTEHMYRMLCYHRHFVKPETEKTYYVANIHTGQVFPLYIKVPCGHCVLCRNNKANSIVQRCNMETVSYGHIPWFVTLTYNSNHLPHSVEKRDVQLFFKRLRKYCESIGIDSNFRYLLVSEYGKRNNRPHYHFILWGFPNMDFRVLRSYIRRAWSVESLDSDGKRIPLRHTKMLKDGFRTKNYYKRESFGFVKVLPMSSGCPAYLVKYLMKQFVTSSNLELKPCFMLASIKNGGIGSAFIEKYVKPLMLQDPTATEFTFTESVVSQKPFKVYIDTYIKNRVLPSASSYYCSKLADCLKRLRNTLPYVKAVMGSIEHDKKMRSLFPAKYIYFFDNLINHPKIWRFLTSSRTAFRMPVIRDYAPDNVLLNEHSLEVLYEKIIQDIDTFFACTSVLDDAYFEDRSRYFEKRRDFFLSMEFEEIDLENKADSVLRRYRNLIDKEIC